MTLQDFKDQVAREAGKGYKDYKHACLFAAFRWKELNEISDRAAELYAKERYDDGYSQGHSEALAGDGL